MGGTHLGWTLAGTLQGVDRARERIETRRSAKQGVKRRQEHPMAGLELTGLEGKVAVITGAGRMRSIGRPIAVEMAKAGCDIVLTGTGRAPENHPDDEKAAGWSDIESVADEVRAAGRKALALVSDVSDPESVAALADQVVNDLGRVDFSH